MTSFREKYGEWAMVLGATDGIGKAAAQELAHDGMNVILVGRREEKLVDLANEISAVDAVKTLVICKDLADEDALKCLLERTRALDVGMAVYVACLHKTGRYWEKEYAEYEQMYAVNIRTFSRAFYSFLRLFAKRGKGAFVTVGSLAGYYGLPYCAEYAAQKAYMMNLTESVAVEAEQAGIDVLLLTAGSTVTPTWLKNKPSDHLEVKAAMQPREVIKEGLQQLGKQHSYIAGETNRQRFSANMQKPRDELVKGMGRFFLKRVEAKAAK